MNKKFKSSISSSLIIYFLSLQLITAYACGVAMKPLVNGRWDFGEDSAENSYINYENGIEKLILTRRFEQSEAGIAWVIPIPAEPNAIKLDVLQDTPQFSGFDIVQSAKTRVTGIGSTISLTQLWTLPLWAVYQLLNSFVGATPTSGGYGIGAPGASLGSVRKIPEVFVYESISKEGITSEVITARSGQAVYEYLRQKGILIPDGALTVLDRYIGNNFSFVASWIDPHTQIAADADKYKGVYITFPTDQIFYPLHPGSVYKGPGLPETIYIVGHVTPKLYSNIKNKTTVEYYQEQKYYYNNVQENNRRMPTIFYDHPYTTPFEYTKIIVNAQPSLLTEDLSISPRTPMRISFAQSVLGDSLTLSILMLIVISPIASLIAGVYTYGKTSLKLKAKSYALVGMGNIITIVGVAILARHYLKVKIWKFLLLFSGVFLLLDCVSILMLRLILGN